jgi:cysteine-rich repeat protein
MRHLPLTALLLLATVASAPAATIIIDNDTPGAVWDGIMDGFPNTGKGKDGDPDFLGNPLSVVLKNNVTEVRSVMEFPLATLADVLPDDIVSATIRFNVDDVLSTLGPGAELNSKSADSIRVHFYAGDGDVLLGDFNKTQEPFVSVNTSGITDATLKQTGARFFEVDARARLLQALGEGTTHLGVLWRTNDSPTGTSLDDGHGGSVSGEKSETSAGSHMPQLIIEVNEQPPPGCGNGVPDPGETCDDGNTVDGDCCSRRCQLEDAGTACSDGDACTTGDVCDGAGTCVPGGPTSCDDGNICTADTCDPESGCQNTATNEGASCDDGSVCTIDDVCTIGVCVGTPITGTCDDGDACTSGDACVDGVCVGEPLCGNGVVDPTCNEECDDGNRVSVDGCSDVCRYDSLLGGTKATECLVSVAFGLPVRDAGGSVARKQICTDNDPTCDADPTEGVCGFDVGVCLGVADARLPACSATPSLAPAVRKPGRGKRDRANRERLDAALAGVVSPGCTAPVRIDVALRKKGKKLRPGKTKLVVRAKPTGGKPDKDTVVLGCQPAS